MRFFSYIALVTAACSISGCATFSFFAPTAHCIGAGVSSVSASAHTDEFVIGYCAGRKSLIAVGHYNSEGLEIILSTNTALFERPIIFNYSNNIAYIERKTLDRSALKITDRKSLITQLAGTGMDSINITDLGLSPDEKSIYFIGSQRYTNYSPIASARPHENDFYSVSVADKNVKRLSFSDEYSLSGIQVSRDQKTIYSHYKVLEAGESKIKKGAYKVADGLPFIASDLTYTSDFPLSNISAKDEMVRSCGKITHHKGILGAYSEVRGYGIYLFNAPQRTISKELAYTPSYYLDSPTIMEKEGVVLFIRASLKWFPGPSRGKRELWSVKLDGTDMKRVPLRGID